MECDTLRRVKDKRGAIAPTRAYATEWAKVGCALSVKLPLSDVACSIAPSYRRRRASRRSIICLASFSTHGSYFASGATPEWATWEPRSRELWGWRFVDHGEPRWRRWWSVERKEVSWWRSPKAGESCFSEPPEPKRGCSASSLF